MPYNRHATKHTESGSFVSTALQYNSGNNPITLPLQVIWWFDLFFTYCRIQLITHSLGCGASGWYLASDVFRVAITQVEIYGNNPSKIAFGGCLFFTNWMPTSVVKEVRRTNTRRSRRKQAPWLVRLGSPMEISWLSVVFKIWTHLTTHMHLFGSNGFTKKKKNQHLDLDLELSEHIMVVFSVTSANSHSSCVALFVLD